MQIIERGAWESYKPAEIPEGLPDGVLFCRRIEDGVDWYEFQKRPFGDNSIYLVLRDNVVQVATRELGRLFPVGSTLIELSDTNDDEATYVGKKYDAGTFSPAPKTHIIPQLIMAEFTTDDVVAIQAAIASNPQLWLLWNAFLAQRDPMSLVSERFLAGWNALVAILGAERMATIATNLDISP